MPLDDRLLLLMKLHTIYGTNYEHEVKEEKEGWGFLKFQFNTKERQNAQKVKLSKNFKSMANLQQNLATLLR